MFSQQGTEDAEIQVSVQSPELTKINVLHLKPREAWWENIRPVPGMSFLS